MAIWGNTTYVLCAGMNEQGNELAQGKKIKKYKEKIAHNEWI